MITKLEASKYMSRSEMNIKNNDQFVEIDECSLDTSNKTNFNQKTQKFFSNISKIKLPQLFRQSISRNKKSETESSRRPASMYATETSDTVSNLDQYMHDSTILMALQDTETKLLDSEKHRSRLELKMESLENEISYLKKENEEFVSRERALSSQIQELERRIQLKDAEIREAALNSRIKEMELLSEVATLSQKLSNVETEKQELKIQKIIECQNRIMEQTLPYTASVENIYDNEDGLFNADLFEEILKEHSQNLDNGEVYRKLSSHKIEDDDIVSDNLLLSSQETQPSNSNL